MAVVFWFDDRLIRDNPMAPKITHKLTQWRNVLSLAKYPFGFTGIVPSGAGAADL